MRSLLFLHSHMWALALAVLLVQGGFYCAAADSEADFVVPCVKVSQRNAASRCESYGMSLARLTPANSEAIRFAMATNCGLTRAWVAGQWEPGGGKQRWVADGEILTSVPGAMLPEVESGDDDYSHCLQTDGAYGELIASSCEELQPPVCAAAAGSPTYVAQCNNAGYDEAVQECELRGLVLASVASPEDEERIAVAMSSCNPLYATRGALIQGRVADPADGRWFDLDGVQVDYYNWRPALTTIPPGQRCRRIVGLQADQGSEEPERVWWPANGEARFGMSLAHDTQECADKVGVVCQLPPPDEQLVVETFVDNAMDLQRAMSLSGRHRIIIKAGLTLWMGTSVTVRGDVMVVSEAADTGGDRDARATLVLPNALGSIQLLPDATLTLEGLDLQNYSFYHVVGQDTRASTLRVIDCQVSDSTCAQEGATVDLGLVLLAVKQDLLKFGLVLSDEGDFMDDSRSSWQQRPGRPLSAWLYVLRLWASFESTRIVCAGVATPPEPLQNEGSCQHSDDLGASYRGSTSMTRDGKRCEPWPVDGVGREASSPYPLTAYPSLSSNSCRNPNNHVGGVWCYTSREGEWGECGVPVCGVAPLTSSEVIAAGGDDGVTGSGDGLRKIIILALCTVVGLLILVCAAALAWLLRDLRRPPKRPMLSKKSSSVSAMSASPTCAASSHSHQSMLLDCASEARETTTPHDVLDRTPRDLAHLSGGGVVVAHTGGVKTYTVTDEGDLPAAPPVVPSLNLEARLDRRLVTALEETERVLSSRRPSGRTHREPLSKHLTIKNPLGSGAYGQVFLGEWHGSQVAVKKMILTTEQLGQHAMQREINAREEEDGAFGVYEMPLPPPHVMRSSAGGKVAPAGRTSYGRAKMDEMLKLIAMELAVGSKLQHPNLVSLMSHSIDVQLDEVDPSAVSSSGCPTPLDALEEHDYERITCCEITMIMELCDGGTLTRALSRPPFLINGPEGPQMDMAAVLPTIREIASGMRRLHEGQVIHADLKPTNVLLRSSPGSKSGFTAKVADFGLSFNLSNSKSHQTLGGVRGTVSYMAPEVLLNRKLGLPADAYSFGVMVIAILCGGNPLDFLSFGSVMHIHKKKRIKEYLGVEALRNVLAPELYDIVYRTLDYDPKERPTFTEICDLIDRVNFV